MAMTVFFAALLSVFMGFMVSVSDGFKPVDCSDLYNSGQTVSGIYSIYPTHDVHAWVYCQMISDGNDEDKGGWTVIQRRMDGSVNFYRPWNQYKRGFGNVESEYWLRFTDGGARDSLSYNDGQKFSTFDKDQDSSNNNCARLHLGAFWYNNCHGTNPNGLENMYQLTRNRKYMLRVDLEDFEGRKGFALYSFFSVGPEADGFKLHVSGFKDGEAQATLCPTIMDRSSPPLTRTKTPMKKTVLKCFSGDFGTWQAVTIQIPMVSICGETTKPIMALEPFG
ncbi:hypothetical protein G5714_000056 [Onychostoma macrolepis]|uniref:Fibrinogen C-terminal domain-containing protein n=1 Tax=Onychostoma macrolepis TaxID=369639 RepID=A0A7J6DG85_9TELE|nr:hypothetical protein G5714_000056 [Onychostoma macrolepis]